MLKYGTEYSTQDNNSLGYCSPLVRIVNYNRITQRGKYIANIILIHRKQGQKSRISYTFHF